MVEKPFNLESLVGQIVEINPRTLLNKKRLFTTQGGIDMEKLGRAINGLPDDNIPQGWVSMEKGHLIYIVGEGNHRVGLACIYGDTILFKIIRIWSGGERFGFNLIVSKIKSELRDSL